MIKWIAKKKSGFVSVGVLLSRQSGRLSISVFVPLELAAVEEKGFEDAPSLKSRQEGKLLRCLIILFIFT